jgi:uroporphyrinogen-III synthase
MFDRQRLPLAGKRVLVTRTQEQARALSERLRLVGAVPVEFPTIQIVPPSNWSTLDAALHRLYAPGAGGYDWLILTSANGVAVVFQRLAALGYRSEDLSNRSHLRIATIGPATAAALAQYQLQADIVPDEYIAEGVIAALLRHAKQQGRSLKGQRILLARAAEARKILVTELERAGAIVDEAAAYYTLPATAHDARGREILHLLRNKQLDVITFTSSSTVRNFVAWLKSCEAEGVYPVQEQTREMVSRTSFDLLQQQTLVASIGPITSQIARELGLCVDIEAQEFTIDGLVKAIVQHEEKEYGRT